jgi:cyclopropane-fatty-acyl-phospholipid synthase
MTDAARTLALKILARIRTGQLTIVEADRTTTLGTGAPQATVHIHDPRAWPKLLKGSRGMAEAYMDGLWDSPDLTALIRVGARNASRLDAVRRTFTPVREPFQRARAAVNRNTPRRNRRDIAAHYDLGNELFELMLDPTLMYSCAVFDHRDATLHEAQEAKLDLVCDKLDLGPRDHVLEIGTGWGGFAVHAATTRGCKVTTTTISKEQHAAAQRRIKQAGVEHLVDLRLDDYRDLTGTYDKLVSLEMIEAVGWQHFGTFFERCSDLLAANGTMLLQAITIDDRAYAVEKASKSFIRTYIFPGGCLPSQHEIAKQIARRTDLRCVHLDDLTPHYAETLRRWRANFEHAAGELQALGYDERFRRLWRLYLSYCEAGFAERRINLTQTLFAKPLAPAERAAHHEVEHLRRPARSELGERDAAARTDDVAV